MPKSKIVVDLFFDVSSPYTWCAFELLTRHRNVWAKMELKLKPFDVYTVYEQSKNVMSCDSKLKYYANDWRLLADYYKIPMRVTQDWSLFPDTKRALRFLTSVERAARDFETVEKATRELFLRVLGNDPPLDVSSDAVFEEICKNCGVSNSVLNQIDSDTAKERLAQNTNEAVAVGSFGTPTMVAHLNTGPQMFFGQDRVELLSHSLSETYQGPLLKYNAFK